MAPNEVIDAVFWWIPALWRTFARLSGYGSITFRRFMERNTVLNWHVAVQLRLLRNEVLTLGILDIRLDAITTEWDTFEIILSQP
jgi:hypothetical protein